jgi:hypothetical protein
MNDAFRRVIGASDDERRDVFLTTARRFSVVMQLGIHYGPAAQAVFGVGPLPAADCALTLLVALGPVTVIEVGKLVRRWKVRRSSL